MSRVSDWKGYWRQYTDLDTLQEMCMDMDSTLQKIEAEKGVKLLSGDHIQIITALEDRIEELESTQAHDVGVQGDLFK